MTHFVKLMNNLSEPRRLELLREINQRTCPECGGIIIKADNEKVCKQCGFTSNNQISWVPEFDQTNSGSPSASIALGRSLGDTLQGNDLYKVLSKGPAGNQDVGLRARFIRILVSTSEHPIIKKMLEISSRRMREWFNDETENTSRTFAEYFANRIRYIGSFLILGKCTHVPLAAIVDSTFALSLKDFNRLEWMNDVLNTLQPDENILEAVNLFFTLPELFKSKNEKRKKFCLP